MHYCPLVKFASGIVEILSYRALLVLLKKSPTIVAKRPVQNSKRTSIVEAYALSHTNNLLIQNFIEMSVMYLYVVNRFFMSGSRFTF